MQLKQLKLAGFKSFVEPTVIPFPSRLVGIVGPNGCGKSNIVDAVRWVMGNNKDLRGESSIDVIFNGSLNRKPVGQASVELLFDNSLGRVAGQYATYQEIAVKRVLTRDGDSSYYLNGSRCRRRDIQDVFLGTGAGARGYAIIGQDMISRLIEARPDELKGYFEEAAGVSKYKERRRETLQRISNTRENLERVSDVREELQKQLNRLERQAKTARRFKALKQEERTYKSQILALKWRAFHQEKSRIDQALQSLSVEHEAQQAIIAQDVRENATLRTLMQSIASEYQQVQEHFYQCGTRIARLETSIQQHAKEKERLMVEQKRWESEKKATEEQLKNDQIQSESIQQRLHDLGSLLQKAQDRYEEEQKQLREQQQNVATFELKWQQQQAVLNQTLQDAEIQKIRAQHLEQRHQETGIRLEKVQMEYSAFQSNAIALELQRFEIEAEQLEEQCTNSSTMHEQMLQTLAELQQQSAGVERQLHRMHDEVQRLATEHAVLAAAQKAAFTSPQTTIPGVGAYPRWVDVLMVEEAWIPVCEWVLGDHLHAFVLNSLEDLWPQLEKHRGQATQWMMPKSASKSLHAYPRLIDKIQGLLPQGVPHLEYVVTAENLSAALRIFSNLPPQHSVITPDGYWLGEGWVKVACFQKDDEPGLLVRKQALLQVSEQLQIAKAELEASQQARDAWLQSVQDKKLEEEILKHQWIEQRETLQTCRSKIKHLKQELDDQTRKAQQLEEERLELHDRMETLAEERLEADAERVESLENIQQLTEAKQSMMLEKEKHDQTLKQARQRMEECRSEFHQCELEWGRQQATSDQLRQNIDRQTSQLASLQQRIAATTHEQQTLELPAEEEKNQLAIQMTQHSELEQHLSQKRCTLEERQSALDLLETSHQQHTEKAQKLQEEIQKKQLQKQSLDIHAQNVLEALNALNIPLSDVLEALTEENVLEQHEEHLVNIEKVLQNLGPINLVAIDEYETELQRKRHLDEQFQDLTVALTMLEEAIHGIDEETKLRLQETYDQINAHFQTLFPRLFGGGQARLDLTSDDLLEAGIMVRAQPPGKKNSTIHALSGGEKAMTAVALVFAIFQLNPSPFCMLDEVDAPLDDANVQRFCDLVKDMSMFVQFLFITHNKQTMELAEHLMGVTMREPGVSRVVAVDVEKVLVDKLTEPMMAELGVSNAGKLEFNS